MCYGGLDNNEYLRPWIDRFGSIKNKENIDFNEKFLFLGNKKKYKITINGKKATIFPDFPIGVKIKIEGEKKLLKIKELNKLKKLGKIIFLNESKPHKKIEGKTKTKVNGILEENYNIGIIGKVEHPKNSKSVKLDIKANKLYSQMAPTPIYKPIKKHYKRMKKSRKIYI